MNWRTLLAILLLWIAWAAIITSFMAAFSFDWTLLAIAVVFTAIAIGLIFAARALTPSWFGILTKVAGLYAFVSVIRAAMDRDRASEQLVIAGFSFACCVALFCVDRYVRRRANGDSIGARPVP